MTTIIASDSEINTAKDFSKEIQHLLPGAKPLLLQGYTAGNSDYSRAKAPKSTGWGKKGFSSFIPPAEKEIQQHLSKNGWIGVALNTDHCVVDIDPVEDEAGNIITSGHELGGLLYDLLKSEGYSFHAIKSPRGMQFIFKTPKDGKGIKNDTKTVTAIGVIADYRTAGGQIVWPTEQTEGRFILHQSDSELHELPYFLQPLWNPRKYKEYPVYPITEGSRNDTMNKFLFNVRRYNTEIPVEQLSEIGHLVNSYFVQPALDDSEIDTIVGSVMGAEIKKTKRATASEEFSELPVEKKKNKLPDPYFIQNGSLYRTETKKVRGEFEEYDVFVSRVSPVITKTLEHIEKQDIFHEVKWKDRDRTYREVVPAGSLATKRELMKLADRGLSVNDLNAKWLIDFFDKFLTQCEVERSSMVDRLGKVGGRFIHPMNQDGIEVIPPDYGERQLLKSFTAKGTVESWIENVFNLVKDHPKALFPVLGSFASVVLHEVYDRPIVIDISGMSGVGKSGVLQVASSVWGRPEDFLGTFNTTQVALERRAAFLNSFPLVVDDSKGVNNTQQIEKMIYQFANGFGKTRGSINGSQEVKTWTSIMITSGENSILEYVKSQGAAGRVIPLSNFRYEDEGIDHNAKIYNGVKENYGAIGYEFLKRWNEKRNVYLPMLTKYKEKFFEMAADHEVLRRLSLHYGFIVFIARVLNDMFHGEGMEINLKSLKELFEQIGIENKAIDMPLLELENILQVLDANRKKIFYDFEPHQETNAIFHKNDLYLTPAFLKEALGVNEKQIRNAWRERGITHSFTNRGNLVDYKTIKKRGSTFKVVPLNREFIEQLGFDFSPKEYESAKEDFS